MAIMKMNSELPDPNPNAGAKNISSKGIVQPMIIQIIWFFILIVLFDV